MDTFFLKSAISKLQQEFEDSYAQNVKIWQKKSSSPLNPVSKLLFFFSKWFSFRSSKKGAEESGAIYSEQNIT